MEYFPADQEIADKVWLGTDWPGPGVPGVRGNIDKFRALPISAAVQQKVRDNAARLFPVRS